MVLPRKLEPQSLFDEVTLERALADADVKPLHVSRIWSFVLDNKDGHPWETPGLPQAARGPLTTMFKTLTSQVVVEKTSADGTTTKLLIQLQDGRQVESVIMRMDASQGKYAGAQRPGGQRATLCISSQIGCQMGCTFCATGTMGLVGNLTAGEIVEQLVHALRVTRIRNVVFMGMGEPLNNYAAVVQAVKSMTSSAFALSHNHITVSTVGIVPRLRTLVCDMPGVNLALSLHAPEQSLRASIVPAARAFPLPSLMAALDEYLAASQRSVFVEYVMLDGVNDGVEQAQQLGALLTGRKVVVNLIPYNPTSASAFHPSSPAALLQFQKILREEFQLHATIRKEMGQDIAGACGQLVSSTQRKSGTLDTMQGSMNVDIEDLAKRTL